MAFLDWDTSWKNDLKFEKSVRNVKESLDGNPTAEYTRAGPPPTSQEEWDAKMQWIVGEAENKTAITTTTCPYAGLTWTKVQTEMDRLENEYISLNYTRERLKKYPRILDFIEAYTEKEIGGDSTKWNEYITQYNKARSDHPKG